LGSNETNLKMLDISIDKIIQNKGPFEQVWTIPEVLEAHDPFPGAPYTERKAALRYALEMAAQMPLNELSDAVVLRLDFWKNFRPEKISERRFEYTTKAATTYYWELTINELGIFYKDISGAYTSVLGSIKEQLFSDFWFFGPLYPIPDLALRRQIVGMIKNTFEDADCAAAGAHFEFFEYPPLPAAALQWSEGNHVRSDFVTVREHGIEVGCITWRDSEPYIGFTSFENFLNAPPHPNASITPAIRAAIEAHLGITSKCNRPNNGTQWPLEIPSQPPTPRQKMDKAAALLAQQPDAEEGAKNLIALLEYEDETDYWRNFVFNCCFKLRENQTVQQFVIQKLQGDNEIHFKKAVDVLRVWGIKGVNALLDHDLLNALNWQDATANDPSFREALEKIIKIIQKA
jgi:hypothetical protein